MEQQNDKQQTVISCDCGQKTNNTLRESLNSRVSKFFLKERKGTEGSVVVGAKHWVEEEMGGTKADSARSPRSLA
ncbi:hypothetical protein X798_00223 [Onchocerca flexuosa]|uniref:Transposase n=2 Tax=Onchocerca flexuosa TaxID=387005 RepID=A0A183HLJ5_9BILA|nr:hypothetical protein X798_00223 [Onchocerca flexuosa]VDO55255.1 unnamed protein product [Onchocerca flexuosa]